MNSQTRTSSLFDGNPHFDIKASASEDRLLGEISTPIGEKQAHNSSFKSFKRLQAGLILFYTIVSMTVVVFYSAQQKGCRQSKVIYCKPCHGFDLLTLRTIELKKLPAPARTAVHYEPKVFDMAGNSIYAGEPSPEVDSAWDDLLKCQTWET